MQQHILLYVQHLLGIGHGVRASRIAAELARAFRVTLVVGGAMPESILPAGVDILRLPVVKAGPEGFGTLVDAEGRPVTEAFKAERRAQLLGHFERLCPDVLLIEAFPFGRRQMRFELIPLVERARKMARRPLIATSIRDILQTTRPERQAETLALIDRYFDLVLVHGDPAFLALDASFPAAPALGTKIRYTGVVGPPAAEPSPGAAGAKAPETFDVIVSVGGGAVGAKLIAAACAARPISRLATARWLVLTGPNLPADAVPPSNAPGLVIRRFAPNLAMLLTRARLSISQAGYNSVADVLAAHCRAVLVPYAAGGETEQSLRSARLVALDRAVVVEEAELDPARLAAAMDDALAQDPAAIVFKENGAARTAEILAAALADHEAFVRLQVNSVDDILSSAP